MKVNVSKFVSEMKRIEILLEDNFDATGPTFSSKVVAVCKEVPKGVFDKLSYLANLLERVEQGEKLTPSELKQAGFWIDAVWPYMSNGVPRHSTWKLRLLGIIIVALLLGVTLLFLR